MFENAMISGVVRRGMGPPYPHGMAVSAHDVAAALRERLPGLPVKRLHKLLYYCQGHHLAGVDVPLFSEVISAWDTGPVVGQLWYLEREGEPAPPPAELTEAQLNTIGYVVSRYGALTGRDLEHLTHGEAPWQLADARRRPRESVRIELSWVERYFAEDADSDDDELVLDSEAVSAWLAGAGDRQTGPGRIDDLSELRARLDRDA